MILLRRARSILLALVIGVEAAAAVQTAAAQIPQKEPSAVIAGRVMVEGAPAAGVTVLVTAGTQMQGAPAGRTTTDDQGNYRVTGLAAGDYTVSPFAPGFYYPASEFYGPRGKTVNLDDGEAVESVDFKLTKGGVISGKITDSSGKPVVEEQVELGLIDENRQRIPMAPADNAFDLETDDRGAYRAYGLAPGRYLVSVGREARPGSVFYGGSKHYYPLTYYPSASDEARAEVVELAPGGEVTGVDIVLGKTAVAFSVRGRVVNSDTGQPVAGVVVAYGSVRPDGGVSGMGFSSNQQSDSRGEFRINAVTSGHYAAFAVPMNDGEFYSDQVPFDVTEGDIEGLQVTLHQGGSIAGVASVEGASDPEIATKLSQVSLAARLQNVPPVPAVYPKPIAADGSFRITGLAPGKVTIYLTGPNQAGGFSIGRVELNGTDQTSGIDVGAGQQITGVRVVLRHGSGLIRGRVKFEGGTLPEATMIMVSARPSGPTPASQFRSARVDSRGLFVIQGVVDGEYDLTLAIMSNRPERRMQPLHQKVTVAGGTAPDVVFVMDLGGQK